MRLVARVVRGPARLVGRLVRGPARLVIRVVGAPIRLVTRRSPRLAGKLAGLSRRKTERLARTTVVASVLLLSGGTAAAMALLAPANDAVAELPIPRAIAEGDLGDRPLAPPHRPGADYYRETSTKHVSADAETGFVPIYREAERTFGVSWRLLASIHRQETAFSTVASTYHGLNAFGCCAGPMQFNVTNGPPSTWARYRQSFRLGDRPRSYPHPTRHHPSIYDDFDAIMAAGALLRDAGASAALDGASWSAAYAYYGHDRFGTQYASQVLGRAQGWELYGFCLNCALDESIVADFDASYGVDARRVLRAADDGKKKKHKKKKRKKAGGDAAREERRESPRAPSGDDEPDTPPPTQTTPAPSTTTTTTPTTTETTPAPAPAPAKTCSKLERLLGCRDG